MVISDENSFPIVIDNIETPTLVNYFWVLQLDLGGQIDFTLNKLVMFEEQITPSLWLSIDGFRIQVPANWNILVYSEDTAQIDVIETSELSRSTFTALTYFHKTGKIAPYPIQVVEYNRESIIRGPSLNKHTMLCHPLGPDAWVCIAPTDNYTKYLRNILIGDLMA
jgi:hypothetical protein